MATHPRPALFLDRDGVINIDHGHVAFVKDFELIPGIFELCRAAQNQGYALVVVTNQAGIARGIVRRRPLATTGDLVAAVRSAVPRAAWPRGIHVATRTFQAVRMAVNDEPGALESSLREAPALLAPGGRLGVIAFHSGEDRMVKRVFRALGSAGFAELEPSPLTPGADEVRANPRARSARLRVLERLP